MVGRVVDRASRRACPRRPGGRRGSGPADRPAPAPAGTRARAPEAGSPEPPPSHHSATSPRPIVKASVADEMSEGRYCRTKRGPIPSIPPGCCPWQRPASSVAQSCSLAGQDVIGCARARHGPRSRRPRVCAPARRPGRREPSTDYVHASLVEALAGAIDAKNDPSGKRLQRRRAWAAALARGHRPAGRRHRSAADRRPAARHRAARRARPHPVQAGAAVGRGVPQDPDSPAGQRRPDRGRAAAEGRRRRSCARTTSAGTARATPKGWPRKPSRSAPASWPWSTTTTRWSASGRTATA